MRQAHLICQPFTYRDRFGRQRYIDPRYAVTRIFDEADPRCEVDSSFQPPALGLESMDADAKAKIDAVRAPLCGKQLPGVGVLPCDTPIVVL